MNIIVRHLHKNIPEDLDYIQTMHDVSQIINQLASEEDANLQSEDETESSAFSVQTSASPAEELSTPLLPPPSTANQELPPLLSQYHDTGKPENISVAADSPETGSKHNLPSPGPVIRQPDLPRKRSWSARIRAWFVKRSRSLQKYIS